MSGEIPFKLRSSGSCAVALCTSYGHEVCDEVWGWLHEMAGAVQAEDMAQVKAIWARLDAPWAKPPTGNALS